MTSRLLSLLQILRRGGSQTAPYQKPNSYAVIQLWKRFFETQEQQAEESISIVEEVLYGYLSPNLENGYHGGSALRPISSEVSVRARRESVQEYYRNASNSTRGRSRGTPGDSRPPSSRSIERQQLHHPNLAIPSANGDSYLSLAQ
jgi:hypothetical protein